MTDQLSDKNIRARLLVVDDEEVVRISLADFLINAGYDVDTAISGEDAMHRLQYGHGGYDIIITDVIMGNMGGLELLEKAIEIDRDSIVILITGYATLESAIHAIRKGAYDFLLKPFENSTLLLTVRRGIERRRLMQENRELIQDLSSKNFELRRAIYDLQKVQAQLNDQDRCSDASTPHVAPLSDTFSILQNMLLTVDRAMKTLTTEPDTASLSNDLQSIAHDAIRVRGMLESLPPVPPASVNPTES